MSAFAAPAAAEGIKWDDLHGHLLVIEPEEHVTGIPTTFGDKDAIRANVHDISESTTFEDTLIFPSAMVGSLKRRVGEKVLAVLSQGVAKPGQKPPWILVDATGEAEAVKAATAYLDSLGARQFASADPVVQEMAAESDNPMLAAALGKLGAKRA